MSPYDDRLYDYWDDIDEDYEAMLDWFAEIEPPLSFVRYFAEAPLGEPPAVPARKLAA